jgi:AraC-like DNA-binding protein
MSKHISSNEFFDSFQSVFLPSNKRDTGSIDVWQKYGDVKLDYFSTGLGITYSSFKANFYEDTILEGLNHYDFSFLCFNTGNTLHMDDCKNKEFKLDSDICWNGQQLKEHRSNGKYSKNKQYISHYITFEQDIFKKLFSIKEDSGECVYYNDNFYLNFNNFITNKQKVLLNELSISSLMDNKLKEIYIESKLLDLVYISVNEYNNKANKNDIALSSQDISSLKKAKTILIENMTNPPSLKELSYKSAINEFKLKKGFKQLFGNTVFGYLQEYRLNEAKALLESNEINIGEASSLVGYKSISHFSKIFKEHFGITPIEIKKEQRKFYV